MAQKFNRENLIKWVNNHLDIVDSIDQVDPTTIKIKYNNFTDFKSFWYASFPFTQYNKLDDGWLIIQTD